MEKLSKSAEPKQLSDKENGSTRDVLTHIGGQLQFTCKLCYNSSHLHNLLWYYIFYTMLVQILHCKLEFSSAYIENNVNLPSLYITLRQFYWYKNEWVYPFKTQAPKPLNAKVNGISCIGAWSVALKPNANCFPNSSCNTECTFIIYMHAYLYIVFLWYQ